MSQTSTPKPKQQFRIVFAPPGGGGGGGGGGTTNVLRKIAKVSKTNNLTDLEAAVSSITTDDSLDGTKESMDLPMVRTINKTPQKVMTLNSPQIGGQKLDKIVFLPKVIQRKVTVVRDSPKKLIRAENIARATPTILASTPKTKSFNSFISTPTVREVVAHGERVESASKRRKLGDIALEAWQANKKIEETPTALPRHQVFCRLCGSLIKDQVIKLLDPNGEPTAVGARLKAITSNELFDSNNAPNSCCKACAFKVQVCYTLFVELNAADEVLRETYVDSDSNNVNLASQIYTCKDCEQEVVGMKDFIRHHEAHVQERTIKTENKADDENDSNVKEPSDEELLEAAKAILEENVDDDGLPTFQNELGEYVCELCGRTFKYKFMLVIHRKETRRGAAKMVEVQQPPTCFVCGLAKNNLTQSDIPCDNCIMGNGPSSPLQPVKEEHSDTSMCPICGKAMKKSSLNHHVAMHGNARFFCDKCGRGFAYKFAIRDHFLKGHNENFEGMEYKTISNSCVKCDKKFRTVSEVRAHMIADHGSFSLGVLSCTVCSKEFPDLFKLRLHLRVFHNINLPNNARSLGHLSQIICHICGMEFSSYNATKIHMKTMHNLACREMEVLKQECELCGKVFACKQSLIVHVNTAHLNIKPMPCDICGARFAKHSSLIFHKLRHTGEKHFKCGVCMRSYRQRNDVIRHLARHVRDKEIAYEDAHAINTSSSKHVIKRSIYLKDSTIKGLLDMTRHPVTKRKPRNRVGNDGSNMYFCENIQDQDDGIYEEVVAPDETIVEAAEADEEDSDLKNVHVVFDGEVRYVVKNEQNAVQYLVEDGETQVEAIEQPEEGGFIFSNENGEFVDQDGRTYIVSSDGNLIEQVGDNLEAEEMLQSTMES